MRVAAMFSGWGGRRGLAMHDAVRALAVAEARIAVQRLALGDWSGALMSATRAEAEAALIGWAPMVSAAERLQARAVAGELREAERVARVEFDMSGALMSWGLW